MKGFNSKKYWFALMVAEVLFLALLIALLNVIASDNNVLLIDFLRNMAISIPFLAITFFVNYKIVKSINSSKWFTTRPSFHIAAEIILPLFVAIPLVIVTGLFFLEEGSNLKSYFSSNAFYTSITIVVLISIFTITTLEYIFQKERNEDLKRENLQMQYQQLKSQINPHFLFNSLNALISLTTTNAEQAVDYILKLSQIYRYVLSQDTKELVTIAEEIEFIKTYIEVLKIRYGETLQCEIRMGDQAVERYIPPMSLQLLVENAVKHNAISQKNPLLITITSDKDEVWVSNNIVPRRTIEDSTKIGLKNLENKYKIISNQQIKIERDNRSFNVILPLL